MPVKILIIEDDPDFALITKTILEQANSDFAPIVVCEAKKGLEMIVQQHPDIILCDYRMPDLNGMDILKEIRTQGIDLPFIVLTASGSERVAVNFMKAGAYDYMIKDVAFEETLPLVIDKALRQYKERKEKEKLQKEIRHAYQKLKEAQKELIQSEKMAALGRFAAGVAHEVKNPLGVILGGIEFLEISLTDADTETTTALKKIKEAILRADDIVQGLLRFARPAELATEKIKPQDFINDTLSLIKYRMPLSNIDIKTEFAPQTPPIDVDKNQLQQVMFNLLVNAAEAMPNGGTLTIATKRKETKGASAPLFCLIEITDTGEGISRQNIPRLFEPFFTTKRSKKGTGLGLPIAKIIVENHGGELSLDSHQGRGTTVRISLPSQQNHTS